MVLYTEYLFFTYLGDIQDTQYRVRVQYSGVHSYHDKLAAYLNSVTGLGLGIPDLPAYLNTRGPVPYTNY